MKIPLLLSLLCVTGLLLCTKSDRLIQDGQIYGKVFVRIRTSSTVIFKYNITISAEGMDTIYCNNKSSGDTIALYIPAGDSIKFTFIRFNNYGVLVDSSDTTVSISGGFNTLVINLPSVSELAIAGMKFIPAKDSTFFMGRNGTEDTLHSVTLTYNFWMDSTEITQIEYETIMKEIYDSINLPAWTVDTGKGDDYPAYYLNWYDAVLFCNARSRFKNLDTVYSYSSRSGSPGCGVVLQNVTIDYQKNGYRLPTEAEWEYACRAGTTTNYYWGDDSTADTIKKYAWIPSNSGRKPNHVALKKANEFELYDIIGNVEEWCNDWYGAYSSDSDTNPYGPEIPTGEGYRITRGGSCDLHYKDEYIKTQSGARNFIDPDWFRYYIGCRIVLPEL